MHGRDARPSRPSVAAADGIVLLAWFSVGAVVWGSIQPDGRALGLLLR